MCVMCLVVLSLWIQYVVFFFNDTATTESYTYGHTLSLHDALPICEDAKLTPEKRAELLAKRQEIDRLYPETDRATFDDFMAHMLHALKDRKSTRLNYSH